MNDSHSESMAFTASVALVLDEIQLIAALRRVGRTRLLRFAIDACLVAHGVRSGHLVDAVSPPNPMHAFPTLLRALRRKSSAFKDVACWHHASTMQSFLVHVPLLRDKITALLNGTGDCVFINLDEPLSVSNELPNKLQETLRGVMFSIERPPDALSHFLSETFTEQILVPLAAVMIDYPVAYVPTFSGKTFLEGEALDIYTVSFKVMTTSGTSSGLGEEHVLLKFSCPRVLVIDHPELSPGTVIENLRARFTARLEHMGTRAVVNHHTETLDRVAL